MSTRTITVIGGDLLAIAAQQLGDPLQWTRIASLNGLWDPQLNSNGPITLALPSVAPNATQTGVIGWNGAD